MDLRLYDIIPALQPYVKVICSMEGSNMSGFRVLPDTCVELFVNFKESGQRLVTGSTVTTQPQSFIISRMNRYMDVQESGSIGSISVCFHPGAASYFFPVPMHELTNSLTGLRDLWKMDAVELEERVTGATSNPDRVNIIQAYLLKRLSVNKKEDKLIGYWLWQVNFFKAQLSVDQLSRKLNISQRQLGRRFNQLVGLSPKEYINVTRFIHALSRLKKNPSISLTEVAYESGYFDQAHFIHECKRFAGLTPRELKSFCNISF